MTRHSAHRLLVDGREIVPMKESQIVEQCQIIKSKGLNNVSDAFAPSTTYRLNVLQSRSFYLVSFPPWITKAFKSLLPQRLCVVRSVLVSMSSAPGKVRSLFFPAAGET